MEILDSATLQRLSNLEFSRDLAPRLGALVFSPDSRTLTSFIRGGNYPDTGGFVVCWDLQTGGIVSSVEWQGPRDAEVGNAHITYSRNGKMVAVLFRYESSTVISIYDAISGVHTHDVDYRTHAFSDLDSALPYVYKIWAHGESLRFATHELAGITIWQVGFALGATPTEVKTVSAPDDTISKFAFNPREQNIVRTEFHPALCRLAFIHLGAGGTLLIWDAQTSKFLLHHTDTSFFDSMTFSSNGNFFACTTIESEVYLWRDSPTGYTLSEKLSPAAQNPQPCLSPNGGSIVIFGASTIQLWHTKSFITTTATSSVLAHGLQTTNQDFILDFLPDKLLAVVTRKKEKVVTILNLSSSVPQWTIDASMEVYGLRFIGDTVVVIGDEKAIIWDLPEGEFHLKTQMKVEDSTQTINFGNTDDNTMLTASISLDLQHIALGRYRSGEFLDVYYTSTGQTLCVETEVYALWFAPGGHDIWCANYFSATVFTITPDALNPTNTGVDIEDGSCPWGSSHGYKATFDGWILGTGGKQLLMLPPLWRSPLQVSQVWNGKFLALLHGALPEPVILELGS